MKLFDEEKGPQKPEVPNKNKGKKSKISGEKSFFSNKLKCFYDVELHNTFLGVDERTTILSGTLNIVRSISGRV